MKIHSACLALLLLPHACLGTDKYSLANIETLEDPGMPLQIGDHHDISISSNVAESDLQPVVSSDGKTSTYTLHHENASYLSVHLSNLDLPTGCSFSLTDGNGGQEYTLTGRGLYDLGTFWGHHVNGDTMVLTLHCDSEMASPVFEVDDYVAGYPNNGVGQSRHLRSSAASHPPDEDFLQAIGHRDLSICGADDKRNAICYKDSHPVEYTKAKAVARLYINGSGACTGWLVSGTSLLFTNHHCIQSLTDVQNTDFEFMGEEDICTTTPGDGSWMSNRGPIFDGSVLVAANESWDYALIQLDGNPAATYGHLELENRQADINEEIYIPQHPGGRPKELGIFDTKQGGLCKVQGFGEGCAPEDMKYTCDTEGGSSGSPVLARSSHKVIALHHCGGGCDGNLGAPIYKFYQDIAELITGGPYTSSPTLSPTVFPGCPDPDNQKRFKIELKTDNYASETSWEVTDSTGGVVASGDGYSSNTVYEAGNCIQNDVCTFKISDSFGDGICCNYGEGYYKVWVDSVEKGDGGLFDDSETVNLCSTPAPVTQPTPAPVTPPTPAPVTPPTPAPVTPPTPAPVTPPTPAPVTPPTPAPVTPPTPAPVTQPTPAPVSSCKDVKVNILTDDYPAETSWTISNQEGNEVASGSGYTEKQTNSIHDVCLESNNVHTFSISDTYGDGICCGVGEGSYQLSLGETTFIEGGVFGSSAGHTFLLSHLGKALVDHSTCDGEVKGGAGEKCSEHHHCMSSMCLGGGICE